MWRTKLRPPRSLLCALKMFLFVVVLVCISWNTGDILWTEVNPRQRLEELVSHLRRRFEESWVLIQPCLLCCGRTERGGERISFESCTVEDSRMYGTCWQHIVLCAKDRHAWYAKRLKESTLHNENKYWMREVAGNWNIQRGNMVRYTAESQISFQLRRRLAGNMARSFANHFARRTVYIGSRNPISQHHRRQVFVDRNELHFDIAEHSVLDEEPLNSAEYACRSRPFRNDKGVGRRRE